MLAKHAVGIATRWALQKPRNLEGSGEAAGQRWLEVSVGSATGAGGGQGDGAAQPAEGTGRPGGQRGGCPVAEKVEEGGVGRAGGGAPCWGGFGSH